MHAMRVPFGREPTHNFQDDLKMASETPVIRRIGPASSGTCRHRRTPRGRFISHPGSSPLVRRKHVRRRPPIGYFARKAARTLRRGRFTPTVPRRCPRSFPRCPRIFIPRRPPATLSSAALQRRAWLASAGTGSPPWPRSPPSARARRGASHRSTRSWADHS